MHAKQFICLQKSCLLSMCHLQKNSCVNSSDQDEELTVSASDPGGLDVGKQEGASAEQLSQSATCEELLEFVSCVVARLRLDLPKERQVVMLSKLHDRFLTAAQVQSPCSHLLFFPELHTEVLCLLMCTNSINVLSSGWYA